MKGRLVPGLEGLDGCEHTRKHPERDGASLAPSRRQRCAGFLTCEDLLRGWGPGSPAPRWHQCSSLFHPDNHAHFPQEGLTVSPGARIDAAVLLKFWKLCVKK